MIKFLKRAEINEVRWDALVAKHPSGLPYAYSWYLDIEAESWEALVLNDYEAVMPLPIAKKYGIPYVYQPNFCQQLGVIATEKNAALTEQFYAALNRRFLVFHVAQNSFFEPTNSFSKRVNFELSLNRSLPEIFANYNESTKRNIAKATKQKFRFSSNELDIKSFLNFAINLSPKGSKNPARLAEKLQSNGLLFLCGVYDKNGELQAADLCIKTHNRIIHLVPVTSDSGRKNGAMHFLLHNIIVEHQQQNFVLDFEGSAIPSIAQFYRSFGASETIFYEKKRFVK